MNSRQIELLDLLKNEFERMNSRTNVGATLIDIASIVQDIDDSKQIRQEIELKNKILRKELYAEFESKLHQVKNELITIGIISEMRSDGTNLRIGSTDDAFFISSCEDINRIALPDGTSVYKLTKLNIRFNKGAYYSSLFNSVDELVKTNAFIDRVKVLAR